MKSVTLEELSRQIGGRVEGDGRCVISNVAPIETAKPGDLSFVSNPIYLKYVDDCRASALIISPEMDVSFRPLLLAENPYLLFAKAVEFFHRDQSIPATGIDPRALIDRTAEVGEEVSIMAGAVVEAGTRVGSRSVLFPGVYIRQGSVLGERCVIYPRVTVENDCVLGDHVILHSGTVVGDWSHVGTSGEDGGTDASPGVEIGDEVELGSNVIVSRGHRETTRIGPGTKMDNLVQIGCGVQIGRACLIVAQAGIGDGSILGDGVTIAGQVTIEPGVEIGQRAIIAARSLVTQKVPPGRVYSGIPARPHIHEKRILACIGKLPSLYRRIQDLEERINPENNS